jgi:hypothetical protein
MFYFSVVFMWALPVYVSSRWILDRHDVDHDGYTATDRVPVWVRRNIPPLLTVLCFIAVMVGQLMALRNAPSVVDYSIAARLEFADTLWAGGQSMWRQIVATLQSAGIYAAHSLSVTIFFAIYIILGAGLLWMNLRGRAGRLSHRVWSVLWWLVTLLVFLPLFLMAAIFLWSFTEEQFRIAFSLGHLAVLPPVTAAAAYIAWWGMRPQPDGASRIGGLLLRLRRHAGERDETAASAKLINPIFFTLLASTVILILCGIILHPIGITEYVYRAQMLPVLLGLPVAFVTYLSDWSVRFRAPLIIAAILLVALGTSLIGDTNDVRTVSGAPARPSLKQSIERWAEVNECDLRAAEGPRKCPPPIIVTAAGGASRASFFVAGLVGKLLDEETALRTNGHTDPVVSASISGDGERILTASLQSIRLWHGRTGALIGILGKGSSYRDPLFSADGKRALTASTIFGARLWDVRSGKLIAVLDPAVESAIFTADGTRIVTIAGDSGPASLWDGATGELVTALGERARAALFSPDGKRHFRSEALGCAIG